MAIVALGSRGTAAKGGIQDTILQLSPNQTVPANRGLILAIAFSNLTGLTGDNGEVVLVADNVDNHWWEHDEHTVSPGGISGDGCTVAVWGTYTRHELTPSDVITITLRGNCSDKCCSLYEFDLPNGLHWTQESDNTVLGAQGFGSASISGLTADSRLFFRGLAKRANSAVDITPTAGFTAIAPARSRDDAAAVLLRGEFKISNVSVAETSNPVLAVTGDSVGAFVALTENPQPVTEQPIDHYDVVVGDQSHAVTVDDKEHSA